MPGLMAASVITMLPMFGDYYTNTYLTERLAADRDDRQPDRVLPARHEPAADRRVAGADPVGVPVRADGLLPRHHRPRHSGQRPSDETPPPRAASRSVLAIDHLAVRPVVAGAGAGRVRISFNAGKSRSAFQSPSLRWYLGDPVQSVWHDDALATAVAEHAASWPRCAC